MMFYDNWFNFLELEDKLKEMEIYSCGTIRSNRLRGKKPVKDKDLRKKGRGTQLVKQIRNQE